MIIKGDIHMKKTALGMLFLLIGLKAVSGQQNKPIYHRPEPGEKLAQNEINALYRKALKDDALPKGAIELELKFKIPLNSEVDEKEIYFKNSLYFSVDERGHVYIPDGALKVIYEFGKDGKLFSKYTKAGQGPGEMNFPQDIFFYNDEVALYEAVVQKTVYFDRNWTYLRSVSTRGFKPFAVTPNGDIYCCDVSREKLIAVLDANGKMIRRFGEPRFPQKPKSTLNAIIAELSPSGSVWVCFSALGIVRKYSPSGELLKEIDFMEKMSALNKENLKENFEWDRKGKPQWNPIFVSIAFMNNDVLLTGGGVMNPIYRLDDDGNLKCVYFIKPEYQIPRDCQFASRGENDEELFYVNTEIGDPAVGVYRPKQQNASR